MTDTTTAAPDIPTGYRLDELDRFLTELIGGQGIDRAVNHLGGDGLALRRFARQCGFPTRAALRSAKDALPGWLNPAEPDRVLPDAPVDLDPAPISDEVQAAKAAHPAYGEKVEEVRVVDLDPDVTGDDPVPNPAVLASAVEAAVRAGRATDARAVVAAADLLEKAHGSLVKALREHVEQGAKRARIAELEAELARLRGGFEVFERPRRPGKSPSARVRAWAAEQGIDCPTLGPVPRRVQEAYDAAHEAVNA